MTPEKGCGIGAEYPHSHLIQLILIFVFALAWIIDGLFLHFSINFGILILDIFRLILFVSTFTIAYWLIKKSGFIISDEIIENGKLVRIGIYAHIRNPMYLGIMLIYLAFLFLTLSLFCLIVWIIIVIIQDIMINYEEKELQNIFGSDFIEYKKKVRKWIP